jgi:hypothetical protein
MLSPPTSFSTRARHLGRRLVGKSHRQNRFRHHAHLLDQVSNAKRDDASLPAARPSQNQHRPSVVSTASRCCGFNSSRNDKREWLRNALRWILQEAAIIKNCAHEKEHTSSRGREKRRPSTRDPPNPLHHRALRPPRQQGGYGRRRPGHPRGIRHQARGARFAACIRTRFSPDLPVPPPTRSRSSARFEPSWSSITATWAAPPSNWPRTGAPTRFLRSLEALLLVADKETDLPLSGQGDVIEPDTGIAAIGSGGPFAQRRAGSGRSHPALAARHRRRSNEDCRQNVHLYQ